MTAPLDPTPEPERIPRPELVTYIGASLHWCAVDPGALPGLLPLTLGTYQHLLTRVYEKGARDFAHLPFFLVFDLLALCLLGERVPFFGEEFYASRPPSEQGQRREYENLLNTLLQAPGFREARERLPLEATVRQGAATHLVELILQRLAVHYPRVFLASPSHVREIAPAQLEALDPEQAWVRFATGRRDPAPFARPLSVFLTQVARHVYWRTLFVEEDLFEVENWGVLDTEAIRIGCRQLVEIDQALKAFRLPTVRLRQEAMEAETTFEDDTTYPTGGFAGLTNRGGFENLVRSELVYMGEQTVPGGPSMFDLRFVESELLYYLRNDGVMRRRRRFIHVVVDLSDRFYYKSPGYAYPFAALTQGLMVRLIRDLLASFEQDAVTLQVHYRTAYMEGLGGEQQRREQRRLEREVELVRLVLGREIRQELVGIELAPEIDLTTMCRSGGRNTVIALTCAPGREDFWRALFLDLSQAKPPVQGITVPVALDALSEVSAQEDPPLALPLGGLTMSQVAQVKNALYVRILGAR